MTRSLQRWFAQTSRGIGAPATIVCILAVGLAIATFVSTILGARAAVAWSALIASWLFLAGLVMGAVALVAAFELMGARWMRPLAPTLARVAFGVWPALFGMLIVILLGVHGWAVWTQRSDAGGFWLNVPLLVTRELAGTALLFWLAWRVLEAQTQSGAATTRLQARAVVFCLVYAVVISLWSFDFVLALDAHWSSTLIGPHVFMGAALSGAAFIAATGVLSRTATERQRSDFAKVCLVLCIFWAYQLWSQYLPIWYGNLPGETGFVLRRMVGPWPVVALAVLVLTFVVPFVVLLLDRARRAPSALGVIAFALLGGLLMERYLLVVPSVTDRAGTLNATIQILVAVGSVAGFVLLLGRQLSLQGAR